jgi:O-antigen ligase
LLLTQIAGRAFLNHPAFGYGSGAFVTLVGDNIRFGANYGDPLDSHGIWQKIIAENGFFGVLTFLIFITLLFRQLYRAIKKYRAEAGLLLPLAVGALGGFVYQCFNTSYYKGKLWLPIAVALVAVKLITMKYERLAKK